MDFERGWILIGWILIVCPKKDTNISFFKLDAIKVVNKEVHLKLKSGIALKQLSAFKSDLEKLLEHKKSFVKDNKIKGIDERIMDSSPKAAVLKLFSFLTLL